MAGSINKVIIVGNLGRDPEVRMTQNGSEVATISVATSDAWKDKSSGEKRERTEWHKVVIFVPHIVQLIKNYTKKGSKVYVEGALQTRKWLSQDNIERYVTEIVIQSFNGNIVLLDGISSDSRGDDQSAPLDQGGFGGTNGKQEGKQDFGAGRGDRSDGKPVTYSVKDLDDEIPF